MPLIFVLCNKGHNSIVVKKLYLLWLYVRNYAMLRYMQLQYTVLVNHAV